MALVSMHAQERLAERLSERGVQDAEALFGWLWEQGRPATKADFAAFRTAAFEGCVYRVAVRRGRCWLIARDGLTGRYVTLIPKR